MISRSAVFLGLVLSAGFISAPPAFGYIRVLYADSTGSVPEVRPDSAGIQLYINGSIGPGMVSDASGTAITVFSANSDPAGAAEAAMDTWNRASAGIANIRFLPLRVTGDTRNTSSPDYLSKIVVASADDLSVMGFSPGKSTGALALTLPFVAANTGRFSNGANVRRGDVISSDILLNSSITFSTDGSTPYDLQGVLTHELGHALGLNHTGLLGAAMFQYASIDGKAQLNQRYLSSDEVSFAAAAYPLSGSVSLGSIAGRVVMADGSPIKYGLLTLIDSAGGNSISVMTGPDGAYSIQVPGATYLAYVEPLSASSVVQARNIVTQDGSLDASQVTSDFQPAMLGGASSPASVSVAAGGSVTAPDLVVTAGTGTLSTPYLGFGKAGAAGDVGTVLGIMGPRVLASGQSIDIAFVGGGFDGTENIQVLGQGISLKPGSLHVDRTAGFSLGPLVRATLDIAPRQNATLASVFVSKTGSSLSLSGLLVLVPPRPAFSSAGVVNAASYSGVNGNGAVSPGGIYSIYDLPNAPNLGPSSPVVNGGFNSYGKLAGSLAGVTVTFDGIPAPLFFVYGGQVNVQVPFEIANRTATQVVVTYQGSSSDPVTVPVVAAQPAFFTITPLGKDSIAANQDYSLNSAQNPAARNSVITIYGTGIGRSSYSVATGAGAPAPPAGYTGGATCLLGSGQMVNVPFAGWTPTAIGLAQWSFVIPAESSTGSVSVKCSDASGNSTQQGTIYVK